MKRVFVLVVIYLFALTGKVKAQWTAILSEQPKEAECRLLSSDEHQTVLKFVISGFTARKAQNGQSIIRVPGGSAMLEKGAPDLPKLTASVIIPDLATMKVEVIHSVYTEYAGYSIAPSKGNLYRDTDPKLTPFEYGPAYTTDAFFPVREASLGDPYILRDFRGQTVTVFPFRFNPVTGILRVYSELTVKISEDFTAVSGRNVLNRQAPAPVPSREFGMIYKNHFKNPPAVQYTLLPEQGRMLIIADAAFMPAMEPFISWKTKKGLQVEMVDMAVVGTTEMDIKSYVSNYYTTNGLTFLLLVGDHQQIPSPMASYAQTGGASDPSYGYISGADSYAEVLVGRFSAQSVADVQTQVLRVLNYEMNPAAGAPFYGKGVCVASDQGPGDDNEYDWEHERNLRADLLSFTYTDVEELYDGSHGGMDAAGDPSSFDLINSFQNGISIVNYTGHGSTNACSTTGFSSNDVAGLTNYNMLPFIWSVACVNGEFTAGNCLAEAFLRAQSGGQPTGAIAAFMSSINQSWDPPMDGQDEMVDLLVGASVHHTMRTFGGLSVNGCMHMNDEYGSAGAEMTDTWHCFGDPSLEVRTAPPAAMTVSHVAVTSVGTTQLTVNCNTDSALVCLSLNGTILGTGMVLGGSVLISFAALPSIDTLDVTVTAFNKVPYMGIVAVTGATGTGETISASGQSLEVYPNPVQDMAEISIQLDHPSSITIFVYDVTGKTVLQSGTGMMQPGRHVLPVHTSGWNQGLYAIRVLTGTNTFTTTILVQR